MLENLYVQVFPKVRSYVKANSGSEDDAIDIFQDAMVCFCKYVKEGKYDESKDISGFLYSVSRNMWINRAKRDKRKVDFNDTMDVVDSYDFSDDIITAEKARYLKSIIRKLGEKCFKLLQLSVYQNKSNAEICRLMGFATDNSVKTQKYKCKKKLMGIMDEHPVIKELID